MTLCWKSTTRQLVSPTTCTWSASWGDPASERRCVPLVRSTRRERKLTSRRHASRKKSSNMVAGNATCPTVGRFFSVLSQTRASRQFRNVRTRSNLMIPSEMNRCVVFLILGREQGKSPSSLLISRVQIRQSNWMVNQQK